MHRLAAFILDRAKTLTQTSQLLSCHKTDPNNTKVDAIFPHDTAAASSENSPVKCPELRRTNSSESTAYTSGGDDDADDSDSDTFHRPKPIHREHYIESPHMRRPDRDCLSSTYHQFHRIATRTIQFGNLALGTTHADVAVAIRGGQLVDVYVNNRDSTASVSFALEEAARQFYEHVQEHGLYIKDVLVRKEILYHGAILTF